MVSTIIGPDVASLGPAELLMGIGDPARARVAVKELLALSPDIIMPATT
jgi:hypothetical protein